MDLPKTLSEKSRWALFGGILLAAAGAAAEESGTLPAVDGVNGKIVAFGGVAQENEFYGGEAVVTLPLGHSFGLQLDGLAAKVDTDGFGDVAVFGAAAHLFWRDPSIGLLGAYGHYRYADALDGVDLYAGGIEGALYLGRVTLEAVAGVEGGEVDTGQAGSFDLDTRFFDVASVNYYPLDDLKLTLGHSYVFGTHFGNAGFEWGHALGGGVLASLFATAGISEDGDGAAVAGLRFYFGQRDKPLIRRHREDDPSTLGSLPGATPGDYIFDNSTFGRLGGP